VNHPARKVFDEKCPVTFHQNVRSCTPLPCVRVLIFSIPNPSRRHPYLSFKL
jgi:hypothetical protein